MKILFVCHRLPFPPIRGGKIRPFNFISHWSKKHTVVVASLAHDQEEMDAGRPLREHCTEVIAEVVPSSQRWPRAVAALPTTTPSSAHYFWSGKLHDRIREAVKRYEFDFIHVHCAFVAPYVRDVKDCFRNMDFGDLDSAKWEDYSKFRAFPLSVGYGLESFKLKRLEAAIAREFDHVTFTTHGEMETFGTYGIDVPRMVIPNGVDGNFFEPTPAPDSSKKIVFLGRMDYFPNIDGIAEFVEKCYPMIRAREPKAELLIVGSNPSDRVKALAKVPGVTVTGFVKDVRPYLAESAVSVVPLRIARGTQNKMLEAMSAEVAVVATPEVAKGVQADPGQHFLLGRNHQEFANEVVRLLHDIPFRRNIAAAGRDCVKNNHSWSRSMELADQLLERVTAVRGSVAGATR